MKLTKCQYDPDLDKFFDKAMQVPDQPTTVPTTISKEKQIMDALAQFSKSGSLDVFTQVNDDIGKISSLIIEYATRVNMNNSRFPNDNNLEICKSTSKDVNPLTPIGSNLTRTLYKVI